MTAIRLQFFTLAGVILVGVWLTGFDKAHWFAYFPIVALIFAGFTGICPGLMIWKKLGFK
jgi:hypothetical protein